jgi:sn-glycerol 3-phosphate transport system substrate-binding protein
MKSRIVLDVWVPNLGFAGWMDRWHQQGRDFEQLHPEYEVRVEGLDFWTYPQVVAEAVAQGRTPALAEYYFYASPVARDMLAPDGSPLFTSVEKAVAGRTEILGEPVVIDDLLPAFRDYFTYQGDLTSLPSVGTTSLLFANADHTRAAGIDELPQTWDDVVGACKLVKDLTNGPAHAITWSNHGTFFQQALALQGGLLANNHNGRTGRATEVNLASDAMLNWVEWWRQLHRDGYFMHTDKVPDWAGTLQPFADGQVAFRISSSNDVNFMARAAELGGFELQSGIFPYDSHTPYVGNAVAGTSIWLRDNLDQETQDGALALLMWLHNPRIAAERHKAHSFVPITQASYDLLENEGWFEKHPYHRLAYDHVSRFPAGATRAPGSTEVPISEGAFFGDFVGAQDIMTHAAGDVLARDADPLVRFTKATQDAQRLLDDYNAYVLSGEPRTPDRIPNSSHRVEYYTDVEPYSAADVEKIVKIESSGN